MKRRDLLRLFLLIIITIFTFSLLACGGGGGKSNPTGPDTSIVTAPAELKNTKWERYFTGSDGGRYWERLVFTNDRLDVHADEATYVGIPRYISSGFYSSFTNNSFSANMGYFQPYHPILSVSGPISSNWSISGTNLTLSNWRGSSASFARK